MVEPDNTGYICHAMAETQLWDRPSWTTSQWHSQTTHSLPHSLTHSPTHPLTHSLTHPPSHSLTHSPTHSLTHSPTHSLVVYSCIEYLYTFLHPTLWSTWNLWYRHVSVIQSVLDSLISSAGEMQKRLNAKETKCKGMQCYHAHTHTVYLTSTSCEISDQAPSRNKI